MKDLVFKAKQAGFSFGWKPIKTKTTKAKGGYFLPRGWQTDAFELLNNEQYMILNSPMGSGKSWFMCYLSWHKMVRNPDLRCIITVPQTIIANGFAQAFLQTPTGNKCHWVAGYDLCKEYPDEGTIKTVIQFLEGPQDISSIRDRVLVCSHSTIVAVYKRLETDGNLNLIKNLLLWVDEAHHLKNSEMEGYDAVASNGIGKLVKYMMDNSQDNLQIGLATASFFRGDRCGLLTKKMEGKFKRYNLPYDRYLRSMTNLKSFSFDFVLCGKDYQQAIKKIIKFRKGKDIIYIPHPQSKHSSGDKYQEVKNILDQYRKVHGGKLEESNGLSQLGNLKLIDLVDEDKRQEKKEFINGITSASDLDSIITLGMFKEGANWIWADRSIIVGARESLVDIIQMIGRLFRDAPHKEHVEVIMLLPFSLDQADKTQLRENLNAYLKAIYSSMILEDILNPVTIEYGVKLSSKKTTRETQPDLLGEALPDSVKQSLLMQDVSNKLMQIIDSNPKAQDVTVLWREYKKAVPAILGEYGITSNIEEIGDHVWARFARKTLRLEGIDVDDININLLKETHPLKFLSHYTTGTGKCDQNTFQSLREAISGVRLHYTYEELKEELAKMRANGKPINSPTELKVWRDSDQDYEAVVRFRNQ